jgi:hypothetical protein
MKTQIIDKLGIVSSTTCAVHCLLLPLIITIIPYFGLSFLANETFEICMLVTSIILSMFSICFGYKTHKNKKITLLFSFGLSLLILGRYVHESNYSPISAFILFIGGIIIALSHYINKKLCNSCSSCSIKGLK